jgi:serralysin
MPVQDTSDTLLPAIDASLDPQAGGKANGKPIFSAEQVAAYLNRTGGGFTDGTNDSGLEGRQNNIGDDNKVITFGFFETLTQVYENGYTYVANNADGVPTLYGLAEAFNFATFNADQRAATREIMQSWDDVAAVSFREVSANDADMNFANLASAPTTQAYARIPTASLDAALGGQVREIGGDSWISASQASNFQLDEGGYGLQTLLHEAGHSLGLSHPGAYNAAPGLSITYAANAEYAQDTRAYSVMSYFQASSLGARHFDFNLSTTVYSGVPLIHDIAAIQRMYGADMTTRTGDTVYGFNSNAGRDSYDFTKTPAPIMAIWDAGGNDTIDASGYATRQVIDLTPGSLSSIGGVTFGTAPSFEQVNINRALAGFGPLARGTYDANMAALSTNPDLGRLTDNVGIAYGAIIENAIGGSGADTIIGNSADNILRGNAGDDLIVAGAGDDVLDGGVGDDEMLGGLGDDSYYVDAVGDIVTELAGQGVDTVFSAIDYKLGDHVEKLALLGTAKIGTGNELDNVIVGNSGSNYLYGGEGIDRLIGGDGHDFLSGGSGADVFVAERNSVATKARGGSFSTDTILDFVSGTDKIDLSGFKISSIELTGMGANKDAGDISFRVFDSVRGAETALGFEIDGIDGPSTFAGPVTIVYINSGGGAPDIALSLIGAAGVTANDFIFNAAPATTTSTSIMQLGLVGVMTSETFA